MNQPAQNLQSVSVRDITVRTDHTGTSLAPQNLGDVVRFAEVMSKADIALPKHLRGNAGACMAVAMQALEWEMSPFAVASKSYSVNDRIAYEAQLIAAVVNTRSGIKGRLRYSYTGEGPALQCTVTGNLDGEDYAYTSPRFDQITTKNSPLWKSDPQQQLGYFAARSWARRYVPEVLLGVYDRDEVETFQGPDNAKDVTPGIADRLKAAQAGHSGPVEGFVAPAAAVDAYAEELASAVNSGRGDPIPATPDEPNIQLVEPQATDTASDPSSSQDDAEGTPGDVLPVAGGSAQSAALSPDEDRKRTVTAVKELLACARGPKSGGMGKLVEYKDYWKAQLPVARHEALASAFSNTQALSRGELEWADAYAILAGKIGCEPEELYLEAEVGE